MARRVACLSLIVAARVVWDPPPHSPAGEARRSMAQARQVLMATPDTVPGPAVHALRGTCQAGTFRVCIGCLVCLYKYTNTCIDGI